jgi:hypothetical protein
LRIEIELKRGIQVVGKGIDVGTKTPTRRPGRPIVESLAGTDGSSGLRTGETRVCVAMTQQSGEFGRGNQSAPQKLPQLVGCRDPNARPVPWVRPRALPVKQ